MRGISFFRAAIGNVQLLIRRARRAKTWRIDFCCPLWAERAFAMSKKVIAFTDGASANNQDAAKRCGGWAAILMLVDEQNDRDPRPNAYKELFGTLAGATNNQAELEAVRQVLLALKRDGIAVTIVTDSEYVIGVLSRH
jgi:hypothetical protein